jgi:hypothetical protein
LEEEAHDKLDEKLIKQFGEGNWIYQVVQPIEVGTKPNLLSVNPVRTFVFIDIQGGD